MPGVPNCIRLKKQVSVHVPGMANLNRISSVIALLILAATVSPGRADVACNPVIDPISSDTTLKGTLSRLAAEYEFSLSLPEAMDRPIQFNKSMTLERLVKRLTVGTSTILKHKKVDGCATPVLTHLIVLPVGQQSDYRIDQQPEQQAEQQQTEDYIYIDNMESFVTDVMEGRKSVDPARLTPEQREEFRMVRDALTAQKAAEAPQPGTTESNESSDAATQDQSTATSN